jgi:hypothetical protein
MNRFTQSVLQEFNSAENKKYLMTTLVNAFNEPTVYKFLSDNLNTLVDHSADTFSQEMLNSDPLPGVTVYSQLNSLNNQFLDDRAAYIKTHLLKDHEKPNLYVLNDGMATSRKSVEHYQQNSGKILESWKQNSGRGMTAREDTQSDVYGSNPFNFSSSDGMHTGIAVCDQSNIGTSHHVEALYGDNMFQKLNNGKLWGGHLGDGSAEGDMRLLNRRIFRSNEDGVENGIPKYEQRLYRRNIDRDVSETLAGREREQGVYKHDMSSLYSRVDERRKYNEKHKHMQQYM